MSDTAKLIASRSADDLRALVDRLALLGGQWVDRMLRYRYLERHAPGMFVFRQFVQPKYSADRRKRMLRRARG